MLKEVVALNDCFIPPDRNSATVQIRTAESVPRPESGQARRKLRENDRKGSVVIHSAD